MLDNVVSTANKILQSYPIKRAALFGSAARGDMTDNSDVDMLIEFLPGRGGVNLEYFGLQIDLEEALGRRVDLLTFGSFERESKPRFKKNVMRDVRVIYEWEG